MTVYNSQILVHNEVWDDFDRLIGSYEKDCLHDVSFLEAPCPGGSDYAEMVKNTKTWQEAQRHTVTASRLPALLGFYGKGKFIACMDIVR